MKEKSKIRQKLDAYEGRGPRVIDSDIPDLVDPADWYNLTSAVCLNRRPSAPIPPLNREVIRRARSGS